MTDSSSGNSGFLAFLFIVALILVATVSLQRTVINTAIRTLFPNYEIVADIIPPEWIILSRDPVTGTAQQQRRQALIDVFQKLRHMEYSPKDAELNKLIGKKAVREQILRTGQTLYFVNPYIAFLPLHIFIAGVGAFLISLFLPGKSSLAWVRHKLDREYHRVGTLLMKQFEAHGVDFEQIFQLPREKREQFLRLTTLPEVVITEVEDYIDAHRWEHDESNNPLIPVKFYFRYRVSASYGNLIQGLVSGGAAILIFVIGLRGLKMIPAEEPSLILMALSIEFILLIVLMITFAGSAQEERLDRVVKELEAEQRDAIKHQTDTIQEVLGSGGGGRSGAITSDSLAEFEEQKLLDEVISMMLKEAERRRNA